MRFRVDHYFKGMAQNEAFDDLPAAQAFVDALRLDKNALDEDGTLSYSITEFGRLPASHYRERCLEGGGRLKPLAA